MAHYESLIFELPLTESLVVTPSPTPDPTPDDSGSNPTPDPEIPPTEESPQGPQPIKKHSQYANSNGFSIYYIDEFDEYYNIKLSAPGPSYRYFFTNNPCSLTEESAAGSVYKTDLVLSVPKTAVKDNLCLSGYSLIFIHYMGGFYFPSLLDP